jgi:acyl-coenzyme A synthetase/AMP-(fatty) acid ligase
LITIQEELIEFLKVIDDIHITYKELKEGTKKISMKELKALTEKLLRFQANSVSAMLFSVYHFLHFLLACLRNGFHMVSLSVSGSVCCVLLSIPGSRLLTILFMKMIRKI